MRLNDIKIEIYFQKTDHNQKLYPITKKNIQITKIVSIFDTLKNFTELSFIAYRLFNYNTINF